MYSKKRVKFMTKSLEVGGSVWYNYYEKMFFGVDL